MSKRASVVAIVGRANVGKSSLFNMLLGRRETIVAREPGTTRDSIMAKVSLETKDFWLVDTAGMKDPADEFELSIQDQITETSAAADVIILVVEADVPPVEEDRRLATLALKSKKPIILIINKIDKAKEANLGLWQRLGIKDMVATSTTQKLGIEELSAKLSGKLAPATIKPSKAKVSLAILGRPNVGKSSLFNALASKQQALVAPQAGTTRDVNRLSLNYHSQEIELADTAGIRRRGRIESGVEQFSLLRTLTAIEQSDICLVVMDVNELNVQLDQKIAGMVKTAGKGLILVVSKWDTLADKTERDQITASLAAHFDFVPWAPLVFTSAITGQNVTKILELALEIAGVRKLQIKTAELNRWLTVVTAAHHPAGVRGQVPKLRYIVQEKDAELPSFKIFGANLNLLHFSYRRYLEHKLRETWPFVGTPIKFWFINKEQNQRVISNK